jgi:NAD(P)-dependent dehydrogenase (short-subunit alcohol dehydrogenase family)
MKLENKVAVITGGASGMGRAAAEMFVREGAKVAIGDIADASDVVAAIQAAGGEAFQQQVDTANGEQVRSLVEAAVERWGGLDIMYNHAGIGLSGPITEVEGDEFDRLFAVNVKGVYWGCKFALPHMLAGGGGSIINMSSNAGLLGRAGDPLYSSSKHAVVGLTKSLAVTYAHQNIRVNAVCPGPIDTPALWRGTQTEAERQDRIPAILATCPAARIASADEVATAVLFLASDDSRFISGVALAIDGAKAAGIMPLDRYRLDFEINQL